METITVNGETHQIESKRATLVFNSDGSRIDYPDRVMITPEMSLNHYRQLAEIDDFAASLFEMVVTDFGRQVSVEELERCDAGFQQLAGLMSLTVRLLANKHQAGWSYPESGLHPKYQGNLADVIIMLTDGEAMRKFVRRVVETSRRVRDCGHDNQDTGG